MSSTRPPQGATELLLSVLGDDEPQNEVGDAEEGSPSTHYHYENDGDNDEDAAVHTIFSHRRLMRSSLQHPAAPQQDQVASTTATTSSPPTRSGPRRQRKTISSLLFDDDGIDDGSDGDAHRTRPRRQLHHTRAEDADAAYQAILDRALREQATSSATFGATPAAVAAEAASQTLNPTYQDSQSTVIAAAAATKRRGELVIGVSGVGVLVAAFWLLLLLLLRVPGGAPHEQLCWTLISTSLATLWTVQCVRLHVVAQKRQRQQQPVIGVTADSRVGGIEPQRCHQQQQQQRHLQLQRENTHLRTRLVALRATMDRVDRLQLKAKQREAKQKDLAGQLTSVLHEIDRRQRQRVLTTFIQTVILTTRPTSDSGRRRRKSSVADRPETTSTVSAAAPTVPTSPFVLNELGLEVFESKMKRAGSGVRLSGDDALRDLINRKFGDPSVASGNQNEATGQSPTGATSVQRQHQSWRILMLVLREICHGGWKGVRLTTAAPSLSCSVEEDGATDLVGGNDNNIDSTISPNNRQNGCNRDDAIPYPGPVFQCTLWQKRDGGDAGRKVQNTNMIDRRANSTDDDQDESLLSAASSSAGDSSSSTSDSDSSLALDEVAVGTTDDTRRESPTTQAHPHQQSYHSPSTRRLDAI